MHPYGSNHPNYRMGGFRHESRGKRAIEKMILRLLTKS
jgi:hypothetical protein